MTGVLIFVLRLFVHYFFYFAGDSPGVAVSGDQLLGEDVDSHPASAIWCLTSKDGLIVAGCGNGRIEVSYKLCFQFHSASDLGATANGGEKVSSSH
jgi:hypothetical protein